MYREKKFDTWGRGLLHLIIVIALPIIPVISYMITNGKSDGYLYVLILTVTVSLLYEFITGVNENCSIWLKIENVVCSILLSVALIITFLLLVLSYSRGANKTAGFSVIDYILLGILIVPVIATIIEIVRCVVIEVKKSEYQPDGRNLVKGASTV